MCSIIGSFSKSRFTKLIELNKTRGSFSFSYMTISPDGETHLAKDFGEFDMALIDEAPDGVYHLGHSQAPTNGLVHDVNRIHPYHSPIRNSCLFHNGIIKPRCVEMINKELGTAHAWDTAALGDFLDTTMDNLDRVEGSFACARVNHRGDLHIFRNQIAPLFINDDCDLSSTKFEGSVQLSPNIMFVLDFNFLIFDRIFEFKNTHNPFYFG